MPAYRLGESKTPLAMLAVVGMYSDAGNGYVGHVALSARSGTVTFGQEIEVFEMGPPLYLGEISGGNHPPKRRAAHLLGWLSLTSDEHAGMVDWLADLRGRVSGRKPPASIRDTHYTFSPPYRKVHRDGPTGRQIYEEFSCVGFVLTCYEEGAGYKIVADDTEAPIVGLQAIERIMGRRMARYVRTNLDYFGNPPWPIIFGGYVFHALSNCPEGGPIGTHSPRIIDVKFDIPLPNAQ